MKGLKLFESGLIPVYENKQQEKVINARELHSILKVETRFDTWINRRIVDYEFEEGKDYCSILSVRSDGKAGKKRTEYLFKTDSAKEIAMVENNGIGRQIRRYFIEVEKHWREEIERRNTYLEAKADFPEFTDAIMSAHEEPKHYHFSNELDMINRIVLGMSAKQFREQYGIQSGKSIRPYLAPEQINAVKSLQRIDIGLIVAIPDFEQRKEVLRQQYNRISLKALSA